MKLKKIALLLLVFVFALSIHGGKAYAATGWYYCEVTYVGLSSAGIPVVRLSEVQGAFARTFTIPASIEKEAIALLLTALSLSSNVRVKLDINNLNSLTAIYLYGS